MLHSDGSNSYKCKNASVKFDILYIYWITHHVLIITEISFIKKLLLIKFFFLNICRPTGVCPSSGRSLLIFNEVDVLLSFVKCLYTNLVWYDISLGYIYLSTISQSWNESHKHKKIECLFHELKTYRHTIVKKDQVVLYLIINRMMLQSCLKFSRQTVWAKRKIKLTWV